MKNIISYKIFNENNTNKCIKNVDGECHVFLHNTDVPDIKKFKPMLSHVKKSKNYIFFSSEEQDFISGDYTYHTIIHLDNNDIFNMYMNPIRYGTDLLFDNGLEKHKDEIKKLLRDNMDECYDVWERVGVDTPKDVMEYSDRYSDVDYDDETPPDRFELLYEFFTNWNDAWCLIQLDFFLDFIESKGYKGFTTNEDGIINLAVLDPNVLEIINIEKNKW